MKNNIALYMLIMAAVTYLIRMLPLALIKKKITNRFFKSFLYYVPFVTLAVMTFPAILSATESVWSAIAAFVVAMVIAYAGGGLPIVATVACVVVYVVERFV